MTAHSQLDENAVGAVTSDAAVLSAPAAPGSPVDAVVLRGGQGRLMRIDVPPVLVVGTAGGSGATTTALGLGAAIATDSDGEMWPVVVDATLGGGDLAIRGCDAAEPVGTLHAWLEAKCPSLPSALTGYLGRTSSGTGVLARTADPLPRRETFLSVHRHLADAGALAIFDGGSPASNRGTAPLLADPRIGLVITVAARVDAINRLKPALIWLDQHFGEFVIGDAVLVVTHQHPGADPGIAAHVRTFLGEWIRAVVSVPYDLHLAEGGLVGWHRLAASTRAAYLHLLGELR